ncbi:DUF3365 domain-containing protein [Hyphomicrobium sp. CS1GBMeth3]|uniref:Tll0287-like domain-containing protein n=1 Tax=Hyphomicrobium sp. CS1GBMeth3 TaxID=1892845 RepID=UPI0009F8C2FA|nr:DUF3365 domain-containing protein [Hyphomicrobium sp. CS1GBMeth3]
MRPQAARAALLMLALPLTVGLASAQDDRIASARTATKALAEALQVQLGAAIKAGGLASAVTACNGLAPAVTKEAIEKSGLTVRRMALKVRNPANAPDAFERKILERFRDATAGGADPTTLEHAETVTENGHTAFRYMKAIPTAATPCLGCHGSDV